MYQETPPVNQQGNAASTSSDHNQLLTFETEEQRAQWLLEVLTSTIKTVYPLFSMMIDDFNRQSASGSATDPSAVLTLGDLLNLIQNRYQTSSPDLIQDTHNKSKADEKIFHQSYRLVALILSDYALHFPDDLKVRLHDVLNMIEAGSSVVPQTINLAHIDLPDLAFLPVEMQAQAEGQESTLSKWKSTPWADPGKTQKPVLFKPSMKSGEQQGKNRSSAKQHLLVQARQTPDGKVLSYSSGKFYDPSALAADHLQSNDEILFRQKELLRAMNLSENYRKKMLSEYGQKGFFILGPNHEVIGTKYFFMLFHNCVNNLWLVNSEHNYGGGKMAQDALVWLSRHPYFGEAFMEAVGPINKNALLYTTRDGKLLAQAAKIFFDTHRAHQIEMNHQIEGINDKLSARSEVVDAPEKYRDKVYLGITLRVGEIFSNHLPQGHSKKRSRGAEDNLKEDEVDVTDESEAVDRSDSTTRVLNQMKERKKDDGSEDDGKAIDNEAKLSDSESEGSVSLNSQEAEAIFNQTEAFHEMLASDRFQLKTESIHRTLTKEVKSTILKDRALGNKTRLKSSLDHLKAASENIDELLTAAGSGEDKGLAGSVRSLSRSIKDTIDENEALIAQYKSMEKAEASSKTKERTNERDSKSRII